MNLLLLILFTSIKHEIDLIGERQRHAYYKSEQQHRRRRRQSHIHIMRFGNAEIIKPSMPIFIWNDAFASKWHANKTHIVLGFVLCAAFAVFFPSFYSFQLQFKARALFGFGSFSCGYDTHASRFLLTLIFPILEF